MADGRAPTSICSTASSVLQPEPGQVAFFPNVDAIQEFKVESNGPPAEFGRFNGGVVNLTTRSGGNSFHGTVFEFFRNEALNARNYFASTNPVKPRFRRNQFGGVVGGPIRQDRTFFFTDYQGQRQSIGRTVISTVPTVLQRQGIFTEAIGGRVPTVYDPATTTPVATGGSTRSQFPGNAIPLQRMDPVAIELLQRYPLPTSAEPPTTIDGWQMSKSIRISSARESIIDSPQPGSRVRSPDGVSRVVHSGDTAAGRQRRHHRHTRAAGHDVVVVCIQLPADDLSDHRQRASCRRHETDRRPTRGAAERLGVGSSGIPGIPSTASFPDMLPTFLVSGYQQLGSPPNTATDFGTSVTQIADSLTWLKGRHTMRFGADLRWERLNVVQPPSPTGSFTFSSLFTDLPGRREYGDAIASFLLGQVQQFSIDLQRDEIRNCASFQEYFAQDDWRVLDCLTVNAGLRYTLNFPSTEEHNQAAVFNLQTRQLDYLGQNGQPARGARAPRAQFRAAAGYRRTGDR